MFPIPLPDHDDAATYDSCIARRRARQVKFILNNLTSSIQKAYDSYRAARGNPAILAPLKCAAEDQKALRSNFSVLDAGSPLYSQRAALLAGSGTDKCPMCGRGVISTLDHYLPQSAFPEYSVLSANLVPACGECNRLKGSHYSGAAGQRFLHAYYDVLPDSAVFVAHVRLKEHLVLDFEVVRPPQLSEELYEVLQFHFSRLQLAHQFRREGISELMDRYGDLVVWFDKKKAAGVTECLRLAADSAERARGAHYWKTALFRALQHSEEFCGGGFELIPHARSRCNIQPVGIAAALPM